LAVTLLGLVGNRLRVSPARRESSPGISFFEL
jgi:hypothetical protein